MITEDKVTEIFCMADDFCKFFDAMTAKYTLKPIGKYWCPLKIIAVFRNVCFVGQPTSWTCREPISGLKSQEKAKKRK